MEPDRGAIVVERPAVPRIDDRTTAGGHDAPDLFVGIGRAQARDRGPLHRPEGGFPVRLEDLGDRAAGRGLDALVEVDECGGVAVREAAAHDALAAPR